ncbi:unnamed protein product [Adineta steineri]|uniref:G-protein coupled receptors family 1 profile domain-containing protein n=1 Tax=Adineta steineri TaxID=433720 RepID=A0A819R7Y7_9BILA|nr:unnamed protein product [Adineta steineri]CAF4035366.1 unnamed protein product [Adineta steineri]
MSSTVIASLIAANQPVIIYFGISILIIGLVGNCLNAIVFLSLKTFRENSCAFYLTIMSIVNIGQLISGLLSRILMSGFNIDYTQTSLFYCKFRTFFFQFTTSLSLACICLASIDQYFATCTRLQWQQWSNIKTTRRILIIITFILMIIQIPCLIYYKHIQPIPTEKTICGITNMSFVQFNMYFNYLFLGNVLPYSLTILFGTMAYRNTQQSSNRTVPLIRLQLDKQLTAMVLVQIVYNFFSLFPTLIAYSIGSYGNIQDPMIKASVDLAYTITLCVYYSYFASSFYIYISVSERFRRQFFYVFFKKHWNRCLQHKVFPNQLALQPQVIQLNLISRID